MLNPRSPWRRCPALCSTLLAAAHCLAQTVLTDFDPLETPGVRPYEMVWANRQEPAPPTVRFDQLAGWTMAVEGGAEAALQVSRGQDVWGRPVAKLRYRGSGKADTSPRIYLRPPQPVALPPDANAVDWWAYGNRWDWENPPGTPPVRLVLHFSDAEGKTHTVPVDNVRWQEWWLAHKRLPAAAKSPLRLERIEIAGGWQPEWRVIYFDSIRGYHESPSPLRFPPRPKRPLTPLPGQSEGANTGPGKLPFPTREETILPRHLSGAHTTGITKAGEEYVFHFRGREGELAYHFAPRDGLGSIWAEYKGSHVGRLLDGAAVRLAGGAADNPCRVARQETNTVFAEYADGTSLRLRIWQKSLVVDVINRSGQATELNFGQMADLAKPRTIWVPYLNYGGGAHPCVLLSEAGPIPVFTSLWLDWYRSNGSEPYAAESAATNTARINGGVRYLPNTSGVRNRLFERLFLTVSPVFEEVLPVIPNPVGLHAREAVDRLWQESWGPEDYEKQMKRSRMLRAYGLEKLIQCNHEITWRDGGESFTLRLSAAPRRGGDGALQRYIAHQRGLGWLAGLYSNYTDYAPVNRFWSEDAVQRLSDGNWRSAWPRCWALKPLRAVELDAQLAPRLKRRYQSTSAYTDVHTAVAPWGYNDYDARVPGAGTFAQTLYAYGELLRNDSKVYGGPIFSEGTYQWLYAGLADGNYALAYDGRALANEPLLPVFDLHEIHTKECDIGMGWTAHFCDPIPNWRAPENLDRAIDRFLLHTLAYGHIGWLVEEDHGLARACRSYYMLQQVQARYGLKRPLKLEYWDGSQLRSVSEALVLDLPRARRQLHVAYPGGLGLWFNDHPSENWTVYAGQERIVLPPAGWAAWQADGDLLSYSALHGSNKVDYLRSPDYVYLDGRGHWLAVPEAAANGGLAIRKLPGAKLEITRISGEGPFVIRRPFKVSGRAAACEAYDVNGQRLAAPVFLEETNETRIQPVPGAIRYVLAFAKR